VRSCCRSAPTAVALPTNLRSCRLKKATCGWGTQASPLTTTSAIEPSSRASKAHTKHILQLSTTRQIQLRTNSAREREKTSRQARETCLCSVRPEVRRPTPAHNKAPSDSVVQHHPTHLPSAQLAPSFEPIEEPWEVSVAAAPTVHTRVAELRLRHLSPNLAVGRGEVQQQCTCSCVCVARVLCATVPKKGIRVDVTLSLVSPSLWPVGEMRGSWVAPSNSPVALPPEGAHTLLQKNTQEMRRRATRAPIELLYATAWPGLDFFRPTPPHLVALWRVREGPG